MPIPYHSLPSYNELFLKYIEDFSALDRFYEFNYKSYEDFFKCIDLKKENYQSGKDFFRNELCDILREQNAAFGSGEKTFTNINLLAEHDTFAIVTGQQLGLLTGPLYTIIKAINAIQLARKLSEKFPEQKFVPVFWLEADDHDFPEINNVNVITKDFELKNISYFEKGEEQEKYLKPAGSIILDEHIEGFISQLEESFNRSDFSEELFSRIRNCYAPGADIKTAFSKFMNWVLGDEGLIFIDPSVKQIKEMLKPVFHKELSTAPVTCEKVINTSVELEESFTVQIKPKAINLFYIHEGNRYLLEPRDNDIFALKHSRQKFTKDELFGLLDTNPERFSWNVVTRPICQDYILPTVAYIGGGAEIAYFGQLKEVYKFFNLTMPVIYPRTSVTIIENRVKTFLEKNDLKFNELFYEKELNKKLSRNNSDISAGQIFSDLKDELNGIFYSYGKELSRIDTNQTDAFMKRSRQFVESMDVAQEKFTTAQAKQNDVLTKQLEKILLSVYPKETLQERSLNITYFLNKYGRDVITQLIEQIKPDIYEHQLIALSPVNN